MNEQSLRWEGQVGHNSFTGGKGTCDMTGGELHWVVIRIAIVKKAALVSGVTGSLAYSSVSDGNGAYDRKV
eukprot:352683-Chlamydomonas_euryale.AAC.2